jgi:hypothetical protein
MRFGNAVGMLAARDAKQGASAVVCEPRVGEELDADRRAAWRQQTLRAIATLLERLAGVLCVSAEAPELRAHTKHIADGSLGDARSHLEAAADILNPE